MMAARPASRARSRPAPSSAISLATPRSWWRRWASSLRRDGSWAAWLREDEERNRRGRRVDAPGSGVPGLRGRLGRRVQSGGRLSEGGAAARTEAPARLERVLALGAEHRGQVRSAVGTPRLAAVEHLAALRAAELARVRRPRYEVHEQREDVADEGEEGPQERPGDVPLLGVDED